MKQTLLFLAILLANYPLYAQTIVLLEDFEDATVTYTTSVPEFSDGEGDFFTRTDGSNIRTSLSYSNIQGASFFAAEDIDGDGVSSPQSLTFPGIDISSSNAFTFSIDLAEDDDGSNQDWDGPDYLRVFYSVDGGGEQLLFAVEADGTGINFTPRIDDDLNGIGEGTEITDMFANFTKSFAATGSSMDLRIEIGLNAGDEDIAIDNVKIETAAGVCGITISSGNISYACVEETSSTDNITASFAYAGMEPGLVINTTPATPNMGSDPTMDSDGTMEFVFAEGETVMVSFTSTNCGTIGPFSLGVSDGSCIPKTVFINEFLADPDSDVNGDGTQSNSGDEFVEIYNTAGTDVDISGWTISNNNTVRHIFAAGTMIGPMEIVTVFGGGTVTGDCLLTASESSFTLLNGGDIISLKNAVGIEMDQAEYTNSTNDVSLALNPDGNKAGGYVLHNTITTNLVNYSNCASNDEPESALPINLTSLTALASEKSILVTWTTATESENDFFAVERSVDGATFAKIGEVSGVGNSAETTNYDFIDNAPVNGTSYYRLRQVDFNGAEALFGPVAVSMSGLGTSVYPNPVSKELFLSGVVEGTNATVLDMNGRVLQSNIVSSNGIDVRQLRAGTYLLRLESGSSVETLRFVRK